MFKKPKVGGGFLLLLRTNLVAAVEVYQDTDKQKRVPVPPLPPPPPSPSLQPWCWISSQAEMDLKLTDA